MSYIHQHINKKLLVFLVVFGYWSLQAQDMQLINQYKKFETMIDTTGNPKERLKLLDSLTTLVWLKKGFNFDSLAEKTIALALESDTADLAAYHIVNRIYYYGGAAGNLNKADSLYKDFLHKHIKKVKTPNRLNNFYKAGGLLNYSMNKYHQSLKYYDLALKNALKTTNYEAIGEIYMGIGEDYYSLGKMAEASQNLQKAIPYLEKVNSINAIINVKNMMVDLYSKNGFYNEAAKERTEALKLAKKVKHHLFLSQLYFNYSVELKKTGTVAQRIDFIRKALEEVEQSRYKKYYKPIYLAALVTAQSEAGNIKQAKKYWQLLEKEQRKKEPGETTTFYKEAKMKLAFAQKKYDKAASLGKDFHNYTKKIKHFEGLAEADLFLSKIYAAKGDYKTSRDYLSDYQKINDSILGVQKANVLSYWQTLYETEKRNAKIKAQKNAIALLNSQNKIKKQWMIFGSIGLFGIFGLFVLVRSRNFAKKEQHIQKQFSQRLLQEQENERRRVSKELHDGVGQKLLLIKNSLKLQPDKTPEMIDETIDEIRSISRNLHPVQLEKFGLTKAIKNIVEDFNELTDIFVSEDIDNIDHFFPKEKEIYLYRIVQECFNNILKHSGASAAKITIKNEGDKVSIIIQDNGKGFEVETGNKRMKSFGLKSLQERIEFLKGNIQFDTKQKQGTVITITSYK